MKRLMLTICLSAAFYFSSTAQVDVQVNPILLLFEAVQVSIEAPIGKSGGVEINYLGAEGESIFFGLGKYYMNPKYGNDKFFIGGFVGYSPGNGAGGGFALGYKYLSAKGISFEPAAGIGRGTGDIDVFPYFKLSVGYRFGGQKND